MTPGATPLDIEETLLAFKVPKSLIPSSNASIQPVFINLKVGADPSYIERLIATFYGSRPRAQYKRVFYVLPSKIGHIFEIHGI